MFILEPLIIITFNFLGFTIRTVYSYPLIDLKKIEFRVFLFLSDYKSKIIFGEAVEYGYIEKDLIAFFKHIARRFQSSYRTQFLVDVFHQLECRFATCFAQQRYRNLALLRVFSSPSVTG